MKSLLDIQKNVKELEGIVRDAACALDEISRDIQDIRESDNDMEMDYDMIFTMASNMPFGKHPLASLKDGYLCKRYIELLLCLIQLDGNGVVEKMTFVQWILKEARLDITLRETYLESLELGKDAYVEFGQLITDDYKKQFVLDMLLTANFAGTANAASVEYIVNLCAILDIDAETIRQYSVLAKIILCQSVRGFKREEPKEVLQYLKYFKHYIDDRLLENARASFRVVAVQVPISIMVHTTLRSFLNSTGYKSPFEWKVRHGDYVEKGDDIFEYNEKKSEAEVSGVGIPYIKKTIIASNSGVLYSFVDEDIIYGVISDDSDDVDSIKAWVRQRGGNK